MLLFWGVTQAKYEILRTIVDIIIFHKLYHPTMRFQKKKTNKVKAKTRRGCVHPREATGGAYYIC